ncbi:protein EOLA1 isoform 2-T5 [Callospermophilus lateralis]
MRGCVPACAPARRDFGGWAKAPALMPASPCPQPKVSQRRQQRSPNTGPALSWASSSPHQPAEPFPGLVASPGPRWTVRSDGRRSELDQCQFLQENGPSASWLLERWMNGMPGVGAVATERAEEDLSGTC